MDNKKTNVKKPNPIHINQYKLSHMIGVAEWMRERASAYEVDEDVAYFIGLNHDIGYLRGRSGHEKYGGTLLWSMGVNSDICNAIAHHDQNPYKLISNGECSLDDITPEYVLLLEADLSVDARGYKVGFDRRLKDIKSRYKDDCNMDDLLDTIEFVKEYQEKHGISKPPRNMFDKEKMQYDEQEI